MSSSVAGGQTAMMQQTRERIFARLDADRSGGVSFAEFQTARQNMPGQAEESAAATELFTRLDANRDGMLSAAEMPGLPRPGGGRFSEANLATLLGQQEARRPANAGLQLQQAVQRSLEAYGRQGAEARPRLGVSLLQGQV